MESFDEDHAIKEYLGISGSSANLSISGPNQIPGIIGDITSFSGKSMRIEVIRSSDKQDLQATLYSLYEKLTDIGYKINLSKQIPGDYKTLGGKLVIFLYEEYINMNDPFVISKLRGLLSGRYKVPRKGVTIVLGLTTGTYALLSENRVQTNEELLGGDQSQIQTTPNEKTKILGFGLVLLSIPMIITWFGILSDLYSLIAGDFLRWFILVDTVTGLSMVLFESFKNNVSKREFVYAAGLLFLSINIAAYLVQPSYSISDYFGNVNFPLYFVSSGSYLIIERKILANFEIIIVAIVIILLILPFLRKKTYFLLSVATAATIIAIISGMLIQNGNLRFTNRSISQVLLISSENLYPFFTTTYFHLNPYFAISINGYAYYYSTYLTFLVFVFTILSNLIFSVVYFSAGIRIISAEELRPNRTS